MLKTQVADTILRQLGGAKFAAMTGAYSFSSGPNALSMRFANRRAVKGRAMGCIITLTPADDYTIETLRVEPPRYDRVIVAKAEGVYCDNLAETFTSLTGLDTRI
jgi:hypothetical protein